MLTLSFAGPRLGIVHGTSSRGGAGTVLVDGERVGRISFDADRRAVRFGHRTRFTRLGPGDHRVRIVLVRGRGFVEGFTFRR